jgi:hypothetical protein
MRASLRYLLLDDFDPDTGELALRVGLGHEGEGPQVLRVKLHLGRSGDPLDPLKRELRTHAQSSLTPLWERGLKTIIHALEEELDGPEGRNPLRYLWVGTQVLHPTDPERGTLNHPVALQVQILREWAHRLEEGGEALRAAEFMERLLLLAPKDVDALGFLARFFRSQGLADEMLSITARWMAADPRGQEARLRHGEALLAKGRADEARRAFESVLKEQPLHPLAHLGMAQALGLLGGNPFPHLDAAQELDPPMVASVLCETFDYRILQPPTGERLYAVEELPLLLGVSAAELGAYQAERGLPATGPAGEVRESELSRWVGVMNRYHLLPQPLHWSAPTPRKLPELG